MKGLDSSPCMNLQFVREQALEDHVGKLDIQSLVHIWIPALDPSKFTDETFSNNIVKILRRFEVYKEGLLVTL